MLTLVIGGSGSGKSAYAERLAGQYPGKRVYLATMEVYDDESRARIRRHRAQRSHLGMETIEKSSDLSDPETLKRIPPDACLLLEDLSNLLANEMFSPSGGGLEAARQGLLAVEKACAHLIVVTNEVFSGGDRYDSGTLEFMNHLAVLNRDLAARADHVTEVVAGIPVGWKCPAGENGEQALADSPAGDCIADDRSAGHKEQPCGRGLSPSGQERELPVPDRKEPHERKPGMIFVTGPLFSGKQQYIQKALAMDDETFARCAVRDVQDLALTGPVDELADSLARKRVVIATEIGGGVVPADPQERAKREAAGRLACCLAERADTVIRICCGLPQFLKGGLES